LSLPELLIPPGTIQRHASASVISGPSTTNECSFAHQRPSCPIVLQMVWLCRRKFAK
jgi:hypothetical protein